MSSLKARVLLTDGNGRSLGECEIISDSQEIFYTNDTPMPKQVGNIPAGTTFDKYSLARIIDDILYEKTDPYDEDPIPANGDDMTQQTIVKPLGTEVDAFYMNVPVHFGSYSYLEVRLYTRRLRDNKTTTQLQTLQKTNTTTMSASVPFVIPAFDYDMDIWVEISTGDKVIKGKMISYRFVSPVYIGWIRPDIIDFKGELVKEVAEDYFQELIDHRPATLFESFAVKSNQYGYVVPNINYDTREQLNPFILIPQSWGQLSRINDINGQNIMNSYANYVGLEINTHDEYIESYIGYVCRQTFADDNKLIGSIEYVTDSNTTDVNMDDFAGNGIPLTVGFSMQQCLPVDERFWVKTYEELLTMLYPYPGLVTYVEDINTSFRFEKGHWTPTNNKTHIIESMDELTEELGGWDDIAINAYDGKLWKKRYNNQWERYGDIKSEDGIWIGKENFTDG